MSLAFTMRENNMLFNERIASLMEATKGMRKHSVIEKCGDET